MTPMHFPLAILLMFSTACQGSSSEPEEREVMTRLPLAGFELSVDAAPDRIINEVALYANKTGFAMRADPLA